MMQDVHIRVKPQNAYARVAFYGFLVLTFGVFAASYAMGRFRGVMQLGAFFCAVTAVLLYTKFMAPVFAYDLMTDNDGVPLFVVTQTIGRRMTTLCRIELTDVVSVRFCLMREAKAQKYDGSVHRYVYMPTLFPQTVCVVKTSGRYERAELFLEGNDSFVTLLNEYVAHARQTASPEEE